jgi:y4mF family transcriptional regulator
MTTSTQPAPPRDANHALAERFGQIVRERRRQLGLRQDDVALASGIGRRFIIDLEAGKTTCQLGKALLVAATLGLKPLDMMQVQPSEHDTLLPDLLDLPDEAETDE